MESLANYGSDDEIDASTSSQVDSGKDAVPCGIEGDNYDDVQMEMSENPLNGSKAPSVQAHSPGWSGGAPPTCATTLLESGSESASKEDDGICSFRNSNSGSRSSSSPASAVSSSNGDESDKDDSKSKAETPDVDPSLITSTSITSEKDQHADCDKDKIKGDENNQGDKEKDSEKNRDKDQTKDRERIRDTDRDRERARERDDRDRRKDHRREERPRSRSRDRRDRRRSPERSDRRRSRDRDERRKSNERLSQERHRRDLARRQTEISRRDSDRKRRRSRSRSGDKHRLGAESRSSSSSGSTKGDARSRESKAASSGTNRGSRSRSKSVERERCRTAVESRKFFLEKKIDRKRNVLERMGIELKAEAKPAAGTVTPQMLVQRTMEQEAAQVKLATGVELPSYYNAAAVNPQRLVDQIQKRKLLWGAKKEYQSTVVTQQPTCNKWQGATFAQDQDGKMAAKFNRLMGIKQPGEATPETPVTGGSEIIKKQEEMFHNMESQYEVARLATHTHRGLGLGFGTFQPR